MRKYFRNRIFPVDDLVILVFMASFPSDASGRVGGVFKFSAYTALRRVYAEGSIFFQKLADFFTCEKEKVFVDVIGSLGLGESLDGL